MLSAKQVVGANTICISRLMTFRFQVDKTELATGFSRRNVAYLVLRASDTAS